MALSAPPPPPDTSTAPATTSADTTTSTTRPIFPRPPNAHPFYSPVRLPSNPNPNYSQLTPRPPHLHPQDPAQLLYPVASSGRGFLSRPVARPSPRPPFVFPYTDQGQGNPGFIRTNHLPSQMIPAFAGGGGLMPGVVKGVPVSSSQQPKVAPPPASIPDSNCHKDLRERNRDDTLVLVRDRKVRVHDNSSIYSLCRSWLRNGCSEETQPQYLDAVKSLPRPLSLAAEVVDSPDKKEGGNEEDEGEGSCENLSAKELLQRHIKRAKRVRSRLREERLQRIARYKTRLALLLPPVVEQHFKNDN